MAWLPRSCPMFCRGLRLLGSSPSSPTWCSSASTDTCDPLPSVEPQHCFLVEDLVRRIKPALPLPWRLAALLHDAPEYQTKNRSKVKQGSRSAASAPTGSIGSTA